MNAPYICTSCRMRVSLLKYSKSHILRRQWLSQATALKQNARRSVDNARENQDAQAFWGSNKEIPRPDEKELRGRYSRQVLRPEQLLQQLDVHPQQSRDHGPRRPAVRARAHGQAPETLPENAIKHLGSIAPSTTSAVSRVQTPVLQVQASDVPHSLWVLLVRLLDASKTQEDDESIWVMLEEVMENHRRDKALKKLGQDPAFVWAYSSWVFRVTKQWLQPFHAKIIETDGIAGGTLPLRWTRGPLQALQFWCCFHMPSRAASSRVVWAVARDVAEFFSTRMTPSNAVSQAVIEGLHQLMAIWHLCMSTNIQGETSPYLVNASNCMEENPASRKYDWTFIPDSVSLANSLRYKASQGLTKMSFDEVIGMFVSRDSISTMKLTRSEARQPQVRNYSTAALVTLDLLHLIKLRNGGTETVRDFEPWAILIEVAVKSVSTSEVQAALMDRMAHQAEGSPIRDFYKALIERWHVGSAPSEVSVSEQSMREQDAIDQSSSLQGTEAKVPAGGSFQDLGPEPTVLTKDASATDRFTYLSIKRLRRAVEAQDLRDVQRVRQDVLNFGIRNPTIQIPQALYEHLILAFLRLRNLPTGVEIWNQMIKAGHRPTSKTFTLMMRGSQHLRDLDSMEYFWNLMRRVNMRPDAHAWSTRVHTLLMKGHTDTGIRALFEMGQDWLAAAKVAYARDHPSSTKKKKDATAVQPSELLTQYEGEVDGVPRPDIIVMNSAISALARKDNHLIPKVLTWGRFFGLEPNLVTYNALLNVSMRHGLAEEGEKILQRMKDRGIEADSTTWTVLLTAKFEGGFINGLEPHEQEAKVLDLISSLESISTAGLDQKGYALIIDRLLKDYDNAQAAQAILAHMASRDVEANIHIYTILMDSYFRQSPPNFAAAENLWGHMQSLKGGYGVNVDTFFYNRMIEGYAAHHALVGTAPMLSLLSRMDSEGMVPSWNAMVRVATSLSETQEWERLAQIVDKTRRRLREQRGADTRHGQRGFWQYVISTGMLSHEGITTPEQVMQVDDPLDRVQA